MEQNFLGKQWNVTLPSTRTVDIRESNGDDEGVLSTISSAMSGDNVHQFLSGVIIGPKTMSPADLMEWHSSDVWYLMFKQRLLNHGPEFKFKSGCSNEFCPAGEVSHSYEFDLTRFDDDLSKPSEKRTDEQQVRLYPMKSQLVVEQILSSGKKIRFKILTSKLEKEETSLSPGMKDKNTGLILRELELWTNEHWQRQTFWKLFNVKEMGEMRNAVKTLDYKFNPSVNYRCPACNQLHVVDIMSVPSFFYPEEGI